MKYIIFSILLLVFVVVLLGCNKSKISRNKSVSHITTADDIQNNGLERISKEIDGYAKKSIRLHTQKNSNNQLSLGKIRIGGRPDLPVNIEWPEWNSKHLSFIAQINLEELSSYDNSHELPDSGFLYFFYDSDQGTWGFDPKDLGSWRVLYYAGSINNLKTTDFPDDIPEEARYSPCDIKLNSEVSYPDCESIYIDELDLTDEETDKYLEFLQEKDDDSYSIHKLLGYPNQIQGDMQLECQLASNGLYCGDSSGYQDPKRQILEKDVKDWNLLLQIGSDDNSGMMWGDVGRLYFWIRKDDLQNKRFDKVWMILQCS